MRVGTSGGAGAEVVLCRFTDAAERFSDDDVDEDRSEAVEWLVCRVTAVDVVG